MEAIHLGGAEVPQADNCPCSLTDVFGDRPFVNVPHQRGVRWLTEIFSRSAEKYPHIPHGVTDRPHTGELLTFAELDVRAEAVAAALSPFLNGPDQIVAVAMSQDNWQIVACHLGILRAGGTVMFLDTTLPDALITHMLNDAEPVIILTREESGDLPTLDVLTLPEKTPRRNAPAWFDDPTHRLATIFYTSGTTGLPKGVECPHAGYVNLALSYADYFDLLPGMDANFAHVVAGLRWQYLRDVQRLGVGLCRGHVDQGADPVRLLHLVPVLREAEVNVLVLQRRSPP